MSGKRAQRRAERHREILDMALEVLVEEGPQGLTMPGLAKRLECAVGGIYRYFASKEALLAALQGEALGAFGEDLQAALVRARKDAQRLSAPARPLFMIARAAWAYLLDASREPTRHRLLGALVSSPDPLLAPERVVSAEEPLQAVLEHVGGLVAQAVEEGVLEPGDARQRTHVLWATVHGLDHMRKRDPRTPPPLRTPALAREALRCLLRGWGGSAEHVDEALDALPRLR